ncbi:ThiF family adenylyltransferase [Sphingorhabdus sp. EL138]|uniref:ThiF family adenylyltransferase n=1 Tax=Sphingorhabdus sp. EL138 TaxID=2073156 RepID=UPI000D69ED0D|nr:ThiF family adenylyltransferase [Sphingorhabdus sp. EL138]
MSQQLINHNSDLLRLQEDGYELDIISGHIVVRNVPYVTQRKAIKRADLVSTLTLSADQTQRPDTHVAMFTGELPCNSKGEPLHKIINSSSTQSLGGKLVITHSFSSKPKVGYYMDYYEKMSTYCSIIANEAAVIVPDVTARVRRVVADEDIKSPFVYLDTGSSRAGIGELAEKLAGERLVIIGVGGTGSYVLDQAAKTPAERIDIIDGDDFLQHNAFRAPGGASLGALRERPKKVDYLAGIYSNMHRQIIPHSVRMLPDSFHLLADATFVFLCLDSGLEKAAIVAELERLNLPFIDVGMGLHMTDGSLVGQLRVTTSTPSMREQVHLKDRIPFDSNGLDNVYARNIQVADLNMMNAALAIVRWKRFRGFYKDLESEHFSLFTIDGNHLLNEDFIGEAA